MTKEFEMYFEVDGVKVGSSFITVTDGKVNTEAAEEQFYAVLRKNESSWIKEAEEEEHENIVLNLTPEQEDKLKEAHAKNYHGTDDDMPDYYERFLEDISTAELKEILK